MDMSERSAAGQLTNAHNLRLQKGRGCVGAGIGFERTRRITGYLVGALGRFNNAKRAEERDRVRHGGMI